MMCRQSGPRLGTAQAWELTSRHPSLTSGSLHREPDQLFQVYISLSTSAKGLSVMVPSPHGVLGEVR